ncbi:MAG: nitroreductase family protein [Planctomycetota bacterium]|jgi:hypothetical protein
MDKRDFLKLMVAGGAGLLVNPTHVFGQQLKPSQAPQIEKYAKLLPPVRVNPFSSELVLNSRYSIHGGYKGILPEQVVANILWAAGKAPVMGSSRTIYAALRDYVYEYDVERHALIPHKKGNQLSESSLALEVGVASELSEDAGASLHYACLAGLSFWTSKTDKPSCCPKDSGRSNANNKWNPASTIHMVNCYGRMGVVDGMDDTLVAHSSDGSLPDPSTDGLVPLESALADLLYGDQFTATELGLDELSQIAWAAYGCTPHTAIGRAALTVASAVANYYLTGRIYIVRSVGVERYHIRLPSGSSSTRDHRIERVTNGDRRSALRSAVSRLPQTAPNYFVFCASTTTNWQLIEGGYCGASALLQATSIDLHGHLTGGFSSAERSAIISALSIPANHYPMVVFSTGYSR